MLRARVATAAVAIPLLLALILIGPPALFALVVVGLGAAGLLEYGSMAFPARVEERGLTAVFGTVALVAAAFWGPQALVPALALAIVAGLVFLLLARPDFEQGLADLGFLLVGISYVGLLMPHFIWLRQMGPEGPRWVVFVLTVGMLGDTAGYFAGRAFGRRKLIPRVSPGKTVEGAVGIMLASFAGGAIAKLLFLTEPSWAEMMFLGGAMGVLGQFGDLSESVMKRTFQAKESGWLFPGHGGVLDRLDSLLFPVTFLYYHLSIFH